MDNGTILKIIQKDKEYKEKIGFILRHRNNLDWEHPTFDDHCSHYAEMHRKLIEDYNNWLKQEIE